MPAAPVSIAIRICRARALDTRTTQAAATPAPLPPLTGALLLLLTAKIVAVFSNCSVLLPFGKKLGAK